MTRHYELRNATSGAVLATLVAKADNPWTRGVGLLGRADVGPSEGLWIGGCGAVHTMFMRATIDLLFLDAHDVVLKIAHAVPPNRLAVTAAGAVTVVELGAGSGAPRAVAVGDRVVLA